MTANEYEQEFIAEVSSAIFKNQNEQELYTAKCCGRVIVSTSKPVRCSTCNRKIQIQKITPRKDSDS
jgi:ABC-type ATPase with predicted acetyltransferase domain